MVWEQGGVAAAFSWWRSRVFYQRQAGWPVYRRFGWQSVVFTEKRRGTVEEEDIGLRTGSMVTGRSLT
jgi:hypothetical protein